MFTGDVTSRFSITTGELNEAGKVVEHHTITPVEINDIAVVPLDEHTFISLTVLLNSGRRDVGLDATLNSYHSSYLLQHH